MLTSTQRSEQQASCSHRNLTCIKRCKLQKVLVKIPFTYLHKKTLWKRGNVVGGSDGDRIDAPVSVHVRYLHGLKVVLVVSLEITLGIRTVAIIYLSTNQSINQSMTEVCLSFCLLYEESRLKMFSERKMFIYLCHHIIKQGEFTTVEDLISESKMSFLKPNL